MQIQDVKFGQFVRANDHYKKSFGGHIDFVGTVVGVTVNTFGEPIAILEITSIGDTSQFSAGLGWKCNQLGVWQRKTQMHPSNFDLITDATPIKENKFWS